MCQIRVLNVIVAAAWLWTLAHNPPSVGAWQGKPKAPQSARNALDGSDKSKPSEAISNGASATVDMIRASDFQLLDAQSTSHDGSKEMIQFKSRKGVSENVDFYTGVLTGKGWIRTLSAEHDGLHLLRFEKGTTYIRIGLWRHDFSDNAGAYEGAQGAIEGTGLAWSGRGPYGNVPERMLVDYERMLGPLSPQAKEKFKNAIRQGRELAMTGGREVPAKAWDAAIDKRATQDEPAPQRVDKDASIDQQKPGKTSATFVVNRKQYEFKHAVAFRGYWFEERAPTILFSDKPIPLDQLALALKKGFDGQEMFKLRLGRHLAIQQAAAEKPFVSGWADNLSLGGNSDLTSTITIEEKRIRGNVAMPKSEQLGPFTYRFEAEFDLELKEIQ